MENHLVETNVALMLPISADSILTVPIEQGVTSSFQNHRLCRESLDLLILEPGNYQLWSGLFLLGVIGPFAGFVAAWLGLPLIAWFSIYMIFGWGGICLLGAHLLAKYQGTRVIFDREQKLWVFRQPFPQHKGKHSLSDIMGVQVIFYVVGDSWFERALSYRLCQINLVCRRKSDGTLERIKLLANTGRKALPRMAQEIAEFLDVPLLRVENQILSLRRAESMS
ncbi:MAG: hypothetical protein Q8K78_04200 [Planctomycetaceae bacterium]|nr:hypothetical protein [Planctomycetaceae bacterium]